MDEIKFRSGEIIWPGSEDEHYDCLIVVDEFIDEVEDAFEEGVISIHDKQWLLNALNS